MDEIESQKKTINTSFANNKNNMSVAELKKWYLEHGKSLENYEKAKESMRLVNPNKQETRTYTTFSRDTLRSYLKNPASNYKKLIELSRFLYSRSNPYKKIIHYNASMINVNYRSVIPTINLIKDNKPEKVLKSYYNTLSMLEKLNLQGEILKMLIIAWREDTAFGCVYYDDTGFFILPVGYDICKVSSVYNDGTLGFSVDMSYFTNRQEQLEFYGDPFVSMYQEYQKDKVNGKWQPMPDENCFCIKVNTDDPTIPLPSYIPLFNSVINLCDTEDLQATKDKASIYKLLTFTLEPNSNSNDSDDFTVDPDTAIEYFNRAVESLPEYVSAVLTPVKVDSITFDDDQAKDVNIIENATKTLYNSSGGAQILNSSTISTTAGWEGAITSDEEYATAILRPQIEAFLNRWLSYYSSGGCVIRLMPVTPYSKKSYKDQLKNDGTYGIPLKLALNTLNGYSELDTLSLNYLEEDILHLSEKFKPMQSSNTLSSKNTDATKDPNDSSNGGGAPKKDAGNLTDKGDASRNT